MPEDQNVNPSAPDNTKATPLKIGTILNGRFKIIELTLNHPILGIHYNAVGKKGESYLVKMDGEGNPLSLVRSEASFLNAVVKIKARGTVCGFLRNFETHDEITPDGAELTVGLKRKCTFHGNDPYVQLKVSKACASQFFVEFVHGGRVLQMIYFVTQFRPGPSLNDCLCALPDGKFTVATSCRAVYFILQAIEWVHKLNYLLRRIDPNVIKYDVEDRVIYLSDLSSVRLDPAKLNVVDVKIKWAGAQIYAPMDHHYGGAMQCRHDIESLIYFLVEMTTGTLPWADIARDKIPVAKKNAIDDKSLFNNCPPAYAQMHSYITALKDSSEVEYKRLYTMLEETWKAAGASSLTEPQWDWEQLLKTDE